jgi:hypothetical protein
MMKIDSPIANLVQVLEKIKQDAETYYDHLKNNEAATRATLIDPLLQNLGWITHNPRMVEFEKTLEGTRIDYALYNANRDVKIIVEAKFLGKNINDPSIIYQVLVYAFKYQHLNIFLTNGLEWRYFSRVTPGNITPIVYNLQNDNLFDFAKFLITNLDAALYWQPKETIIPSPPTPDPQPELLDWLPLSNLKRDIKGQAAPKSLRLPDGTEKEINYWRDILYDACLYVLNNNPDLDMPLPDQARKKRFLITTDLPKMNMDAYRIVTYQGKKVAIFLGYSAFSCIKNALHVLNYLPTGKDNKVYVKF